jgi:hypothetical protein
VNRRFASLVLAALTAAVGCRLGAKAAAPVPAPEPAASAPAAPAAHAALFQRTGVGAVEEPLEPRAAAGS